MIGSTLDRTSFFNLFEGKKKKLFTKLFAAFNRKT